MSDYHPEEPGRMLEGNERVNSDAAAVLAGLALVAAVILAGLFLLPAEDLDSAQDTIAPPSAQSSTTGSGPSE
jgi:hypothetical protein